MKSWRWWVKSRSGEGGGSEKGQFHRLVQSTIDDTFDELCKETK